MHQFEYAAMQKWIIFKAYQFLFLCYVSPKREVKTHQFSKENASMWNGVGTASYADCVYVLGSKMTSVKTDTHL